MDKGGKVKPAGMGAGSPTLTRPVSCPSPLSGLMSLHTRDTFNVIALLYEHDRVYFHNPWWCGLLYIYDCVACTVLYVAVREGTSQCGTCLYYSWLVLKTNSAWWFFTLATQGITNKLMLWFHSRTLHRFLGIGLKHWYFVELPWWSDVPLGLRNTSGNRQLQVEWRAEKLCGLSVPSGQMLLWRPEMLVGDLSITTLIVV